jgi:hypothetical protein
MGSEEKIESANGREKMLAANEFSPVWIENQTPKTGWPDGDGPENHHYSATVPEPEPLDDGVVPPLVIRARQMGLDI